MTRFGTTAIFLLLLALGGCAKEPASVLVFSKTEGWRHDSIEPGVEALQKMGIENGFSVTATEDNSLFTDKYLDKFDAIVFLCTTGDVLDPLEQQALQRYVQAGGGYLGIHSASDTEYDWPWYGQLVGGYFSGHPGNPNVREGKLIVTDTKHPSTSHLSPEWIRSDEWYDIRDQYAGVSVLINVDESTYKKPEENPAGAPRPIAWYHEFEGGRAFYTGLGHTKESWSEPDFLQHIRGGITYAAGTKRSRDYAKSRVLPEENRFRKTVLDQNLNEPMELDFVDDDHIIFVERGGEVKMHRLSTGETTVVASIAVSNFGEEGLIGVAVDPGYAANKWIYLAYSDPLEKQTHLSRFVLDEMRLDRASEVRVLSFPVDRDDACCHMGGSIEFDADGNLYLSVGDNTNPFASDGYDPIDERPGRHAYDAQRSSGNSMDLRGKILRITPRPDGSYTIPAGNLFTDASEGRPEIYVMGNRNPFRISLDQRNGNLYWGEVGPDANRDADTRGPRGYDEINQAREAGYFGWPYVIGNNISYYDQDFATGKSSGRFDPTAIINDSPNNTGAKTVPPAKSAFIWYPYNKSDDFPNLGSGGRTAMAGPVFYASDYPKTNTAFPSYYDGRLFVYEWMRGWIATAKMNEAGDLLRVDRFLEETLDVSNPMDMLFGPDGSLYLLEYGKVWSRRNLDARLSRITFNTGNREPVAKLTASRFVGKTPLAIEFSGLESYDADDDGLVFEWDFDGNGTIDSNDPAPVHTYNSAGVFTAALTIRDGKSASDRDAIEIWAGNEPPSVGIELNGNQSFYFDGTRPGYNVFVNDAEDGSIASGDIDPSKVTVSISFVPEGNDLIQAAVGHQSVAVSSGASLGEQLVGGSDCLACHQTTSASNGPSFQDVAKRYAGNSDARPYLVEKILSGGSGIWGERPMAAHPNLDPADVGKMVDYIRSLANAADESTLPLGVRGTIRFDRHDRSSTDGRYIVTASYRDSGGDGIPSLTSEDRLVLRSPYLEAEGLDATPEIRTEAGIVFGNGSLFLKDIDLGGVRRVTFALGPGEKRGRVSIRLSSRDGAEIGAADLLGANRGVQQVTTSIQRTDGFHDLFFVLSGVDAGSAGIDKIIVHDR